MEETKQLELMGVHITALHGYLLLVRTTDGMSYFYSKAFQEPEDFCVFIDRLKQEGHILINDNYMPLSQMEEWLTGMENSIIEAKAQAFTKASGLYELCTDDKGAAIKF